ncbi:hypothetical protein [Sphingomonas sp. 1185]|uniref:hypothetical protein n=1 Tax=Sphingomonas sp. 1185 TaxID=3156411 RepID=UPI00339B4BB8
MVQDHASFDNYRELTSLIETGLEALATARAMLHRLDEQTAPHSGSRRSPSLQSISGPNPQRMLKQIGQDRRRTAAIDRLVALQPRVGRNGAAILLRLLDEPGVYIACDELVRAAGIRTADVKAVKVYICHLRCGLRMMGISAEAIQTGRRSYRLIPDVVAGITALLGENAPCD